MSGTWSSGGDLPHNYSTTNGDGSSADAIQASGTSEQGYITDCNEYNGSSWSAGGNISTARRYHAISGNSQDALLTCGHNSAGITLKTTEAYNGTAWAAGADAPTALRFPGGGGWTTDGLLFGGWNGSAKSATSVYNGTSWTSGGALSQAKYGMAGDGTTADAICAGGYNQVTETEEYNGTSWSSGGTLTVGRAYLHGGGATTNAIVAGGYTTVIIASTEEYDGTSWSAGGALLLGRDFHAGGGSTANAIVAGGSGTGASNTSEIYTDTVTASGYYGRGIGEGILEGVFSQMELIRAKNTATYIVFPIKKDDGSLLSGAAGLDSGIDSFANGSAPDGFTDCTNEATEIGSTGIYYLFLSQSECNVDQAVIVVNSSTSGAIPQVILINFVASPPAASEVADAVWDEAISEHTTSSAFGGKNQKLVPSETIGDYKADLATLEGRLTDTRAGYLDVLADLINAGRLDLLIDEIKAKTDLIPASPAAVGSKMDISDSPSSTGLAALTEAVWSRLLTDIFTTGSIGKLIKDYLDAAISSRLASSSYTSPPSVGAIDAQLSASHGASAWGASTVGAITYPDPDDDPQPFLDSNDDPLGGVKIMAYSDSDRTTLVDVQITDINGMFAFHLDAGTYYFRAILAGYGNFEWSVELTA